MRAPDCRRRGSGSCAVARLQTCTACRCCLVLSRQNSSMGTAAQQPPRCSSLRQSSTSTLATAPPTKVFKRPSPRRLALSTTAGRQLPSQALEEAFHRCALRPRQRRQRARGLGGGHRRLAQGSWGGRACGWCRGIGGASWAAGRHASTQGRMLCLGSGHEKQPAIRPNGNHSARQQAQRTHPYHGLPSGSGCGAAAAAAPLSAPDRC